MSCRRRAWATASRLTAIIAAANHEDPTGSALAGPGGTFAGAASVSVGSGSWRWYLLRLDAAALAYLRTQGFRHGPADVLARIAQCEIVDPGLYYFRVQRLFEAASATYDWLNWTLAVESARRTAEAVVYDAYRVT